MLHGLPAESLLIQKMIAREKGETSSAFGFDWRAEIDRKIGRVPGPVTRMTLDDFIAQEGRNYG